MARRLVLCSNKIFFIDMMTNKTLTTFLKDLTIHELCQVCWLFCIYERINVQALYTVLTIFMHVGWRRGRWTQLKTVGISFFMGIQPYFQPLIFILLYFVSNFFSGLFIFVLFWLAFYNINVFVQFNIFSNYTLNN